MITIKLIDFWARLGDIYLFVYTVPQEVNRAETQRRLVNIQMSGYPELISSVMKDSEALSQEKLDSIFTNIYKLIEKSTTEKINKYPLIIINQALVMMCTVYEIFLMHVLDSIFRRKPETLLSIAKHRIVTLEQVLESDDKETILEFFRRKFEDHFSRQGIREKFDTFAQLGIKEYEIFNFSAYYNQEAQKKFAGYDLEKLTSIFDKRHDIVHSDTLPLQNATELGVINEFFQNTGFMLTLAVGKKFKIPSDFAILWKKSRDSQDQSSAP